MTHAGWHVRYRKSNNEQDENDFDDEASARAQYEEWVALYHSSFTIQLILNEVVVESKKGTGTFRPV